MTCEEIRESAAVALLMRAPLDDEVRQHLSHCPECAAEVARLAPIPALLGLVDGQTASGSDTAPGSDLLDRLLAAAARDRRRARSRIFAIAAAVVLLLVLPIGLIVARSIGTPAPSNTNAAVALVDWRAADASSGVSGRAQVWKSAWGSDLTVSIAGVASGTRCTVVVVTRDGQQQTAATWVASYAGTANVKGTVAAAWKSIARVDIVDETGRVLLHIQDT